MYLWKGCFSSLSLSSCILCTLPQLRWHQLCRASPILRQAEAVARVSGKRWTASPSESPNQSSLLRSRVCVCHVTCPVALMWCAALRRVSSLVSKEELSDRPVHFWTWNGRPVSCSSPQAAKYLVPAFWLFQENQKLPQKNASIRIQPLSQVTISPH